jgi:hypothetical protein
MRIFVDIDNTICKTQGNDYWNAEPIPEAIKKINRLFDEGNTIIYWSARGGTSGKDWTYFTDKQLRFWDCKFHFLIMNEKLDFDLIVDDRAVKIEDL